MNMFWPHVSALNLLLEPKACYSRFLPLFDLLCHRYFPEIFYFLLYQIENLFKSLKQQNKLVGI